MNPFRKHIVDGLSNLAAEVLAETVNKISQPGGSQPSNDQADVLDVESEPRTATPPHNSPPPRPALPPAPPPTQRPPAHQPIAKPAQNGARPDQRLPAFPFPAPLELPPESQPLPQLPSEPPPGPRTRGRSRRNQNGNKPALFADGNGNGNGRAQLMQPRRDQEADKDQGED